MFTNLKENLLPWLHALAGASKLTYAAIGIGLLVALLYFKLIFGDRGGFKQDVENDAKIPLLDKDYDFVDSRWSHNKILIWILLSAGSGVLAYHQLPGWFPNLFR
jgi:hypothetical protein